MQVLIEQVILVRPPWLLAEEWELEQQPLEIAGTTVRRRLHRESEVSISMSRALSNGPKSGALSVVSGSILSAKTGS